jgi:hypothetical protein
MAYWDIAYASGPNYNRQWGGFDDEKQTCLNDAYEAVANAKSSLDNANDIESELIKALDTRYPKEASVEDFGPLNDAFADAKRQVYQKHPNDMDICTLFTEAIMNRTPWKLWDLPTGKPAAGADTLETIEVFETAFDRLADQDSNKHPGLLHMYIHLMEMSP